MKKSHQFKLLLGLLAVVLIAFAPELYDRVHEGPEELSYSELLTALDEGDVERIAVLPGKDIQGEWADSARGEFVVDFPTERTDDLIKRAQEAEVVVQFRGQSLSIRVVKRLANIFVFLLYGALIWFFGSQMRVLGSEPGELADNVTTSFEDVGGTQGAAEELREIVDFLKTPKKYHKLGAKTPRGVLMVGPSGTGKTLMARAVAGDAGVPFYHLSGSEITGMFVGLGVARIQKIFKKARKTGGVIFFDEIDTLAAKRGGNRSHNEDDRSLNQLLVEMDGFKPSDNVVVMGATNRPDILDEAVMRPGRFDRVVHVGLPSVDGREEILLVHARKREIPLAKDVDLRRLAVLMPNRSGAELENLLNEAAIAAAREGAKEVAWSHFEAARDRVFLGRERKGFIPQERERRIVAYHEIGHAITGLVHVPEEGLHKVTIQARGQSLGVAHFSPSDEQSLHSLRYLKGQLVKAMGGRAAEEIVFGAQEITSGAGSDLEQANKIARTMVARYGMGERVGYLVHSDEPGVLSPDTLRMMDEDVRDLIQSAYETALSTLNSNRDVLETAAVELLEREMMDREDLEAIIARTGGLKAA